MKQTKTILEWYNNLKQPYRDQAIANCIRQEGKNKLDQQEGSMRQAIDHGMVWRDTLEGHHYWQKVAHNTAAYTISAESTLPEAPTKSLECDKPNPTPMHKYSDQPVATPTLVFGTDVTDLNANACISTISANNKQIKELTDTGIKSPYIDQQIAGLNAANAALVKRLDSFAAPAAPEA